MHERRTSVVDPAANATPSCMQCRLGRYGYVRLLMYDGGGERGQVPGNADEPKKRRKPGKDRKPEPGDKGEEQEARQALM